MDTIVIPAMVVGLLAAYPGWLMFQKAYYTSQSWYRVVTALFCLLLPLLIAASCFIVPFLLAEGRTVTGVDMFTDFVIFAVCPAAFLALLAYVLDFVADQERPRRALVAGAALFAIALLPIAYYLFADEMMSHYQIVVQESVADQ